MKKIIQYAGLIALVLVAIGLAGWAGSKKAKEAQKPLGEIKSSPNAAFPSFIGGTTTFIVSKSTKGAIRPGAVAKIRLKPYSAFYPRRWDIDELPSAKTAASDSSSNQWQIRLADDNATAVFVTPPDDAKGKYSISITGDKVIQEE